MVRHSSQEQRWCLQRALYSSLRPGASGSRGPTSRREARVTYAAQVGLSSMASSLPSRWSGLMTSLLSVGFLMRRTAGARPPVPAAPAHLQATERPLSLRNALLPTRGSSEERALRRCAARCPPAADLPRPTADALRCSWPRWTTRCPPACPAYRTPRCPSPPGQ
jgi:hypothetical protein